MATATQAATLDWFGQMVATAERFTDAERAELEAWEAANVNGNSVGTSDWPGWTRYLMPRAEYVATVDPRRGRRVKRRPLPFRAVWDRDGWLCKHCGDHRDLTVDHIIALARGGTDDFDNLQTLCGTCNRRKWAN